MLSSNNVYELMHKDKKVGLINLDVPGNVVNYVPINGEYSPFMGNADLNKIKVWWSQRSVPGSRKIMEEVIKKAGCLNSSEYLAKNMALSMTDAYWLCPIDISISWEDVKLRNQLGVNKGILPHHNATSYDPNASLGGQMEKYWDLNGEIPVLVKTSLIHKGQQGVNEAFATMLHQRQKSTIPYVKYSVDRLNDEQTQCFCDEFTSDSKELINAYEVVESQKTSNSISVYDSYIEICAGNGIDREVIQQFMDYQTLTDFIISNDDEHLLNFGVLRDSETFKLIGPAPIFDSGNSMFFSEYKDEAYTRAEILERTITSFFKSEDKMLSKVKDKGIVKTDLLPTVDEAFEFYADNGIPEQKASFIANCYGVKLEMVNEFQHGKKISLYHEKHPAQEEKSNFALKKTKR